MAGRKADPNSKYRVYIHISNGYSYAAIQISTKDEKNGKFKNKILHLGSIDKDLFFNPNIFLDYYLKKKEKNMFSQKI